MKDDELKKLDRCSISRRTFLGAAGSVAAGAALPIPLGAANSWSKSNAGGATSRSAGSSASVFHGVFASTENMVKACEQPFRKSLCLNGSWQFQSVGLPDTFQRGSGAAPDLPLPNDSSWEVNPLIVPSPWNVNSFADHHGEGGDFRTFPDYPTAWENVEMGWLRKTFIRASKSKGRIVSLQFDAVAGDAIVIVNGKTLAKHFDIFLPFTVDATEAIAFGQKNELLVGVRKASLFDKKGQYGRRVYQGGSFWGQHIAGIWQDVFLIETAPVHVSDVYILPRVDADALEARATVSNCTGKIVEVALSGEVFPWLAKKSDSLDSVPMPSSELGASATLQLPKATASVPAHGSTVITLKTSVRQRLPQWTPATPHLHGLVVTVRSSGNIDDVKYTRSGWRQFTFRGPDILLNGETLILRGDSWHFMGIPQMTRRYAWAWFTALREAGLNAVRLHAQPYPAFYLDVADEIGILVLDETAVWASDGGPKLDDSGFWNDTEQHLSGLILRDRNHPSVFGWSVCNEMRPIIRSVLRNPPGLMDELVRHYEKWADICKQLDPTRPWISADGDEDGEGKLPVYLVHYGGRQDMERAVASGKPWGVGETGNAYYATPEQVAETNGERAYESFEGRMEGVAVSSYNCLIDERTYHASYRSVFNLVWYGLYPLPFGLNDTSRAPALNDGIFFSPLVEGQPGVQPQRLGPYCSTLNPGYDPTLPLYRKWPLFDAIREASSEPPAAGKWAMAPASIPPSAISAPQLIQSAAVIGGQDSELAKQLLSMGVPLDRPAAEQIPQILFVDGILPPEAKSRAQLQDVLDHGGTVFVWGADSSSIAQLNALLPAPLSVVERVASSLLLCVTSPITIGLKPSSLYLCNQRPSEITRRALAGPLVAQSTVLLKDCDTDWMKWNGQPEFAKTAMVLRSELETKHSGVVLAEKRVGEGRLLMTTLSSTPATIKAENVARQILTNLGFQLKSGMDSGKPLLRTGTLVRALACGFFSAEEAATDPWRGNSFREKALMGTNRWQTVFAESGNLNLTQLGLSGSSSHAALYLSFWVSSPRSITDLLLEPNLPQVDVHIAHQGAIQVWLNDELQLSSNEDGRSTTFAGVGLRQSWNHFLVRIAHDEGALQFEAYFSASQPEFVAQLGSALEKP